MRYRDIKVLNEADQITDYLDQIDNTAEEKGGMPADLYNRLKKVVQDIKADIQAAMQRQKDQPSDAMVEDASNMISPEEVDEYTDAVEKILEPQLQGITDPEERKKIIDTHSPRLREVLQEFEAVKKEQFEKERVDFMQAVDAQLKRLAEKIDGHVVKDWQAPDVKMTKADIKKEKTRLQAQDGLMNLFDSLFRNKVKTGQISEKEALTFATAAADGKVIDMNKLVAAPEGHGKIDDYVNNKHKKVYSIIIDDLLNTLPGATGGNIGPGELALAALGNPTEKALDKGDLLVGEEAYEIKGGSTGETNSGGRLNSSKIKDGKSAYSAFESTLKSHKDLWKALNELAAAKELAGGTLVNGFTLRGVKNYEKAFNKAGINKAKAVQILDQLVQDVIMNYDEVMQSQDKHGPVSSQYHDLLDKAVLQTKEGINLQFQTLMKAITFAQYHSYNLADKVEKIMLINKANRTFSIIDDGQDFMKKIESGHAIPAKYMSVAATDPQTASFHWTSK